MSSPQAMRAAPATEVAEAKMYAQAQVDSLTPAGREEVLLADQHLMKGIVIVLLHKDHQYYRQVALDSRTTANGTR